MNEQWKPVVGFESVYRVSNFGRVRSLDRIDAMGRPWAGRVLRPGKHPDGHVHVRLSLDGKVYTRSVHRLVLEAFVGPCPERMEACHSNGVPDDNRATNLRWDTREANWEDRKRHAAA